VLVLRSVTSLILPATVVVLVAVVFAVAAPPWLTDKVVHWLVRQYDKVVRWLDLPSAPDELAHQRERREHEQPPEGQA
jgi:hypothetical protein